MVGASGFEEFYLVTRMRLLRQLTMMTGDAEQAADVLQEAYARAWRRWRQVSRLDSPEAWVRTVAWRVAVSQHGARWWPRIGSGDSSCPRPPPTALPTVMKRSTWARRCACSHRNTAGPGAV